MASIVADGVVLRLPYAIINNFRRARPFSLSIAGQDYRPGFNNQEALFQNHSVARAGTSASQQAQQFVYVGDVISFSLVAPANATDAAAFDIVQVNPSTGATTKVAEAGFDKVWQKNLIITITAINSGTGVVTFTRAVS
jgi:hypothetical protein